MSGKGKSRKRANTNRTTKEDPNKRTRTQDEVELLNLGLESGSNNGNVSMPIQNFDDIFSKIDFLKSSNSSNFVAQEWGNIFSNILWQKF